MIKAEPEWTAPQQKNKTWSTKIGDEKMDEELKQEVRESRAIIGKSMNTQSEDAFSEVSTSKIQRRRIR